MKKILITLAALGLSTGAMFGLTSVSLAQDTPAAPAAGTLETADTDANGTVNFAEAQVAWPTLTQEAFDTADANKDGALDATEFTTLAGTFGGSESVMTSPADSDEDTRDAGATTPKP